MSTATTTTALSKCFKIQFCKIRHIVVLRQMLRRWRSKARMSSSTRAALPDIPRGHLAVYVGPRSRRFVFPAAYLNHPIFNKLLAQTEEQYGFDRHGPLTFPCEESLFEEVLRVVSSSASGQSVRSVSLEDIQLYCRRSGIRSGVDQLPESRSLLDESSY